jgi:hypothetical protein
MTSRALLSFSISAALADTAYDLIGTLNVLLMRED